MTENKFRENEVVRLRGKDYPLLAGRIRLALESSESIIIRSELLRFDPAVLAVSKVTIETPKGTATAHGSASLDRDPEFAGALCELSESRACGRALKLLGYGLEVGFEEIGTGVPVEGDAPRHEPRQTPDRNNANGQHRSNGSGGHHPPATSAQRRAIIAIARSAGREVEDLVRAVYPGAGIDDLTLTMASAVIDRARSNGNGHPHAAGPGR